MRHQALRPLAVMLAALLLGAAPARAASLTFEDVARAVGATGQVRPADEVRLRLVQSGRAAAPQTQPQTADASAAQQPKTDAAPGGGSTAPAADATLSQSGGQVETVDLGDVTGTVCDCGEIEIPDVRGGGFPWWPLAGIPLICVSGICFGDEDEPPPPIPPTTPTPPTPVPEPATLLLFGSGLLAIGARARRRYGRKGLDAETAAPAEEV